MRFLLLSLFFITTWTAAQAQVSVMPVVERCSTVIAELEKQDAQILLFQIDHVSKGGTSSQTYTLRGGNDYFIIAIGDEERIADVDLCVYDSDGDKVKCDADDKNIAIVDFTSKIEQKYKFVVSAYKMNEDYTDGFFGLIVARMK
jgi:hypothetical protein